MPKLYEKEPRRKVCERLLSGEQISKVVSETDISSATLHRWRDQALIDAGLKEGTKSIEVDELAVARRTIEELEAELAVLRGEMSQVEIARRMEQSQTTVSKWLRTRRQWWPGGPAPGLLPIRPKSGPEAGRNPLRRSVAVGEGRRRGRGRSVRL
jgi:transposase